MLNIYQFDLRVLLLPHSQQCCQRFQCRRSGPGLFTSVAMATASPGGVRPECGYIFLHPGLIS